MIPPLAFLRIAFSSFGRPTGPLDYLRIFWAAFFSFARVLSIGAALFPSGLPTDLSDTDRNSQKNSTLKNEHVDFPTLGH